MTTIQTDSITTEKLCRTLGIGQGKVDAWVLAGMPYARNSDELRFNPSEVAEWLLSTGRAKRARVVQYRRQVAEHFGCSLRTVATWQGVGMPGTPGWGDQPGSFDLDEIQQWMKRRGLGQRIGWGKKKSE